MNNQDKGANTSMASTKTAKTDLLKTAMSSKPNFNLRTVEYCGANYELREPAESQLTALYENARTQEQSNKEPASKEEAVQQAMNIDPARLRVWGVICCTFVPGTNEAVFGPEHFDEIYGAPASFLAPLKEAAMALLSDAGAASSVEESVKNSS